MGGETSKPQTDPAPVVVAGQDESQEGEPPLQAREMSSGSFCHEANAPAPPGYTYRGPGPRVPGLAAPCFESGLLYRVLTQDDMYAFYNDAYQFEVHVTCAVGPKSDVRAIGQTIQEVQQDRWVRFRTVVYPGETKPMFQGTPEGLKVRCAVRKLSLTYQERITAKSIKVVGSEHDAVVQLAHGRTDVEKILASCVLQRVAFVDTQFPPVDASLKARRGSSDLALTTVAWLRPSKLLRPKLSEKPQLFKGGISPTDIGQGQLGDSWFLGAVAALADYPDTIRNLFPPPPRGAASQAQEHSIGACRVLVNKNGWWTLVTLDDYLPCIGNVPCFAHTKSDPSELWVSMLEKAYAKVHGGYAAISGGDALHALGDLTGCLTLRFDEEWLSEKESDAITNQDFAPSVSVTATAASMSNFDMELENHAAAADGALAKLTSPAAGAGFESPSAAGSPSPSRKQGFAFEHRAAPARREVQRNNRLYRRIAGLLRKKFVVILNSPSGDSARALEVHNQRGAVALERLYQSSGLGLAQTYAVLDAKAFPDLGIYLVKLRNPWADGGEWTGPWSDESPLWKKHPSVAVACGELSATDSTFWMEWGDVMRFFDGGGVCFARPSHPPMRDYRVRGQFRGGFPSVCVALQVRVPVTLVLSLSQRDQRLIDHGVKSVQPGGGAVASTERPQGSELDYVACMLAVCAPVGGSSSSHTGQRLRVDATSSADPSVQSNDFTFVHGRDCGLMYTFKPTAGEYIILPRVYNAGESRDYVIGIQSEVAIDDNVITARFVHLPAASNAFRNYSTFRADGVEAAEAEFQAYKPGAPPHCGQGYDFIV